MLLLALLGCPDDETDKTRPTGDDDDTGTPGTPTGHTGGPGTADTAGTPTEPVEVDVVVTGNDAMVLERRYAVTASRPEPLDLACTSPDDPLEDHHLALPEGTGEVRLFGVLPSTTYTCALLQGSRAVWEEEFTTAALPSADFPTLTVSSPSPGSAHADDGYLLFSHWNQEARPKAFRLMMTDPEGRVRWYQTLAEAGSAGIAAEWLGDRLVVGGGTSVRPSLRTLSGEVLAETPPPVNEFLGYHHEARLLDDGRLLSIQGYPGTNGAGEDYEHFRVEMTDPATGIVSWTLDSADLVARGLLPEGGDADPDPYHANAAQRVVDAQGDAVWVSLRGKQRILRVDVASGAITDVFGHSQGLTLVDAAGRALTDREFPFVTHHPYVEGDLLVAYDNGGGRPGSPKYSRAVGYRRDSATRWTLLWEHREAGWFEPNYGGIQRLSADHWLIASGHDANDPNAGGQARQAFVIELDAATNTVLWRATFPSWRDSIYRAQAVHGCDVFANRRYCAGSP